MTRRGPAALALAVVLLSACGHGHASSQASALATNPAVIRAEAAWKPVVTRCAQHRHWITHPVRSGEETFTCSAARLNASQRKQAKTCMVRSLAKIPGLHSAATAAEDAVLRCLALAKPKP